MGSVIRDCDQDDQDKKGIERRIMKKPACNRRTTSRLIEQLAKVPIFRNLPSASQMRIQDTPHPEQALVEGTLNQKRSSCVPVLKNTDFGKSLRQLLRSFLAAEVCYTP
jgi:hypothetical protein